MFNVLVRSPNVGLWLRRLEHVRLWPQNLRRQGARTEEDFPWAASLEGNKII